MRADGLIESSRFEASGFGRAFVCASWEISVGLSKPQDESKEASADVLAYSVWAFFWRSVRRVSCRSHAKLGPFSGFFQKNLRCRNLELVLVGPWILKR